MAHLVFVCCVVCCVCVQCFYLSMFWVKWGLLYGIDLIFPNSIFEYSFRDYFGTATYVDYLTFSHLNPITNPTPLPNATLTIGATAHNPNYRGSRVYLNYRGSCTQP